MEEERRWEELPIDSFLTVMNKLTLEEKTLTVPFVCKSWHETLLLPHCWKVLNFHPLYVKLWDSFAERFVQVPEASSRFKEKNYGSSGATSGLTSSLAFTPVQGIELTNPQAHGNALGSGTQSTYFSEIETFSKIKRT